MNIKRNKEIYIVLCVVNSILLFVHDTFFGCSVCFLWKIKLCYI